LLVLLGLGVGFAARAHAQSGEPEQSELISVEPEPGTAPDPDAGVPAEPAQTVTVTPAPPGPTAQPPAGAPSEMLVTGERTSPTAQLQRSAEAVNVIDTRKAKEQTADLGEVLARTQGVAVQRDGGLGSNARFALNGLSDDQVRFLVDGIPIELAGYPFGLANVPVNLVDHVEVYRGVVPIRFGADALGGVVNLVTADKRRSYFGGSYQVGSFGTHRVTVDGRYRDEDTGFTFAHAAFLDVAKNDYDVTVDVRNEVGQLGPATVPRFHDGYRAFGGTAEVGVTDRPWAKRLTITGFASTFDKQLQNNVVMTVPYGEVTSGETVYGATARYDVALSSAVRLEITANYSHRIIGFHDASEWEYDWYGQRVFQKTSRGEVSSSPTLPRGTDSTIWQNTGFGRALVSWELSSEHILRASVTPTFTTRSGENRLTEPNQLDALKGRRQLLTSVAGLEYEADLFDDVLANVVFVKDYLYHAESQSMLGADSAFSDAQVDRHSLGVGDSLRVQATPWLLAKASYEFATRLPRPDEIFGDGALVRDNLPRASANAPGLLPEISHNVNLGPRVELRRTAIGDLTLDVNAFLRETDRLIVLLRTDNRQRFENVYSARGLGLENAVSWVSPRRFVYLDGMFTWQDVRNTSSEGTFGSDQKGDRIPNRPYMFGSWGARLHFGGFPGTGDFIEPFYFGRYVHSFFRAWESQGDPAFKATVPSQVSHNLGLTWIANPDLAHVTATLEMQNLTNAKLYDNFGVQRPGRAIYLKLTATVD
jgi:outer membrane receptor protein involved in Fe transport